MTMLGSEGFEYDGREYTATLRFAADGAYEGVSSENQPIYPGNGTVLRELSREEATEIWWGLTFQQREVITDRCWEDAKLSEQGADAGTVWAAF